MTYRQLKLIKRMENTYNAKFIIFEDRIGVVQYVTLRTHIAEATQIATSCNPIIDSNTQERQLLERAFRIKRKIKYYLQSNPFNLFWTLTFNDMKVNATNYEYAIRQMRAWLKYQREKLGKFDYLFIPELYPKSGRIHFH